MDLATPPQSFLPDSPNIPGDRQQHRHEAICPADRGQHPGPQREIRISAATVQATDDSVTAIVDRLEVGCMRQRTLPAYRPASMLPRSDAHGSHLEES